jgi:hypothetical protein
VKRNEPDPVARLRAHIYYVQESAPRIHEIVRVLRERLPDAADELDALELATHQLSATTDIAAQYLAAGDTVTANALGTCAAALAREQCATLDSLGAKVSAAT